MATEYGVVLLYNPNVCTICVPWQHSNKFYWGAKISEFSSFWKENKLLDLWHSYILSKLYELWRFHLNMNWIEALYNNYSAQTLKSIFTICAKATSKSKNSRTFLTWTLKEQQFKAAWKYAESKVLKNETIQGKWL